MYEHKLGGPRSRPLIASGLRKFLTPLVAALKKENIGLSHDHSDHTGLPWASKRRQDSVNISEIRTNSAAAWQRPAR